MSTDTKERIKRIAKATYEYLFTTRRKRELTGQDIAIMAAWWIMGSYLFHGLQSEVEYESFTGIIIRVSVLVFGAQLLCHVAYKLRCKYQASRQKAR
jgi:hypothetical protein